MGQSTSLISFSKFLLLYILVSLDARQCRASLIDLSAGYTVELHVHMSVLELS